MELADFPDVTAYCEHFIKVKHNQIFAIDAGFHDEQIAEWEDSRQSQRDGCQTYINSAQTTLEDAQNGAPLANCEVCHNPVSTRAVWCIHCGHPQPISKLT